MDNGRVTVNTFVHAWANVAPPGWTGDQSAALQALISGDALP